MLTADTCTEIWTNRATFLNGILHKFANTILVKYLEWVYLQDLLLQVDGQERCDVITRVTEGHLRQVIRTK